MIYQDCRFGSDVGEPRAAGEHEGRRPKILVIYTNIAGTLAALNAAVQLSKGLEAKIVLLVAEELAPYYSLDHPPVAAAFFRNVCLAILAELGLDATLIRLEIHFCRRQVECLQTALGQRSIVVLGTGASFWRRREHNLARTLKALGHDALLVPAGAFGPLSKLVVKRMSSDNLASELA